MDLDESIPPKRKLVDTAGLILFIIVTLSWIGIGIFAHTQGDIKSLLDLKDSYGQRCGKDVLVQHKPYLYYFDITLCADDTMPVVGCESTRVCVKECPSETFFSSKGDDIKNKSLICRKGSEEWNKDDCAPWYLPSISYNGRCIPESVPNEETLKEISNIEQMSVEASKMARAIRNIKFISEIASGTKYFTKDVIESWWKIIIAAVLILIVCIVYFCIFDTFPKVLFIFSLFVLPVALGVFIYFAISRYILHKQQDKIHANQIIHFKEILWLVGSILLCTAAFFIIFMTLFWIKDTFKGFSLIKFCSSKFKDTLCIIFVATSCWILQIIIFIFFVSTFLHLSTISELASYKINMHKDCVTQLSHFGPNVDVIACDPDYAKVRNSITNNNNTLCRSISCEVKPRQPKDYIALYFVNVMFYVWLIFFVFALEELITALFVCEWQFLAEKPEPKCSILAIFQHILIACRYHIGTACVGAILIALFKYAFLKILLIWTAKKSKNSKVLKRINCCFQLAPLIEKIYGVIDTQLLVVCVIYNKSFTKSSKFYKKNAKPDALDKLRQYGSIYYIVFYQKLLVTLFCTSLAYLYVTYLGRDNSLAYSFLMVFFTLYMTYVTGCIIFGIYTIKLDALQIYILNDTEVKLEALISVDQ